MINILSVSCGLGFGPYLIESVSEFLKERTGVPRVVRQGGTGLIIRPEREMRLRYQNREAEVGIEDGRHFEATIGFRMEFYDVARLSDEVVLATVGKSLLLSHPQSELWLDSEVLLKIVSHSRASSAPELPEWLSFSTGGSGTLLSDLRTGRWVLLGAGHLSDMERRFEVLASAVEPEPAPPVPLINLKTVRVRLQSSLRLLDVLKRFSDCGEISVFEEIAPGFRLRVSRVPEGIEVSDGDEGVRLTQREARKWVPIIRQQLAALNASQSTRGRVRTVTADGDGGRWVLQWGDEVFVPAESISQLRSIHAGGTGLSSDSLAATYRGGLLVLLSPVDGKCVALAEDELSLLRLL